MKPAIFIIDDDASVRKGLSRLLRSAGFAVETFATAEQFLEREHYEGIGCLVLDVRMPGISGIDLQDELSKADYSMPIVFITGHGNIPMSVQAMKKGAVDFLAKPFDDEELLQAVSAAIKKDTEGRAEHAAVLDIRGRLELLTPREYEILRYVITGMLNKQIAYELGISEKTVKVHRGRIMEKLDVGSVADLVRLAEKVGITSPTDN
ncbi:MAG: response regulator transcription factor [Deltaproteobacteria bacterium]|nr:response regulator transcription factor [Deltaproteobacteria bacterium]